MRFRPLPNPLRLLGKTRLSAIVLRAGRELKSFGQLEATLRISVPMAEQFEPHEIERIRTALTGGCDPSCPRCGGRFDPTDVPPRKDVPYVRDRIWLICVICGAGLVMNRPKTPPG